MAKKDEKDKSASTELQSASQRPPAPAHWDEFEQWFEDFFPRGFMRPFFGRGFPDFEAAFGGKLPKVDVIDREDEIVVRAELPGVDKDGLDVSLSDNLLTIRAKTKHETEEEKGHFHRREISRGEFSRSIRLPANVEGDKTTATFKEGILELVAPKAAGAKRQSIKIE